MDIVDPRIDSYIRSLQGRHDEPALLEMEAEGERRGFPIVGRNVGVTLEVLARSAGARRVFDKSNEIDALIDYCMQQSAGQASA